MEDKGDNDKGVWPLYNVGVVLKMVKDYVSERLKGDA